VVIDVFVRPSSQRTLLLKDSAQEGIEFLKGVPVFTSKGSRQVKWIYQGKVGYTKFIYLARIWKKAKTGDIFKFNGEITVKAPKTTSFPLLGNRQITAMPFSWADTNTDHMIDDEEILEAYDLLSGIKESEQALREVELLWSAGGYRWDLNKRKFQPVNKGQGDFSQNHSTKGGR